MNDYQVLVKATGDAAEDVTNLGAQEGKNSDDNNSNQNENESVLYQTLTFFTT
jgi:hypothetical protein